MSHVLDIKAKIAKAYEENCAKAEVTLNKALVRYLNEPEPDPERLNLIFRGNHKLNFSSRLSDEDLILLCSAAEPFAKHISHVDFSYNLITDTGINSLGRLLGLVPRLESLNLQGNLIEIDGAKELADNIKKKTLLSILTLT